MAKNNAKIYSVSQINTLIKVAIEENLPPRIAVTGQVSDWKRHASGHCYFSLKDENSILQCVMWKSKAEKLKFDPENGLEVLAKGHIDLYLPGGRYQLYIDSLAPGGIGALQLAFEQMVKSLQAEGLFDDEHKKPIPPYPMRIGVVTSESAAALKDVAESIYNRWPCAKLLLYPASVQGQDAPPEIASAIRDINKRNKKLALDVLIIARGGGSLEDLWAFNEEIVARAIYNSKIPVISAVGHEVDITIADLVADARASTPTKAGVIAAPNMTDILGKIENAKKQLDLSIRTKLRLYSQNLKTIQASAVFRNPYCLVAAQRQQTDEITAKVVSSAKNLLFLLHQKLNSQTESILKIEPGRMLEQKKAKLNMLNIAAETAIKNILAKRNLQLTAAENRLHPMDPREILKRGYSITKMKQNGRIIRDTADVRIGDTLITELAGKNLIESKVEKK